jgi:hypothetical protein
LSNNGTFYRADYRSYNSSNWNERVPPGEGLRHFWELSVATSLPVEGWIGYLPSPSARNTRPPSRPKALSAVHYPGMPAT